MSNESIDPNELPEQSPFRATSPYTQECIHCLAKIPPSIVFYQMSRGNVCGECFKKIKQAADTITSNIQIRRKQNSDEIDFSSFDCPG